MEEIKPKRKANTQVTGEHAPSARRAGRTDKNQQNGNAAARKNNKRRAPRSTAASENHAAAQSVPAPRPRRARNAQQGQNPQSAGTKSPGATVNRRRAAMR